MSSRTTVPGSELEQLIAEAAASGRLIWTMHPAAGKASMEVFTTNVSVLFAGKRFDLETEGGHVHVLLDAIGRVRFVREPDPHAGAGREALRLRLLTPEGAELVSCSWYPLYDEQGTMLADRRARWEALRAHYAGGREEVLVRDRALVASVAGTAQP